MLNRSMLRSSDLLSSLLIPCPDLSSKPIRDKIDTVLHELDTPLSVQATTSDEDVRKFVSHSIRKSDADMTHEKL